jgi:hypothetical protein
MSILESTWMPEKVSNAVAVGLGFMLIGSTTIGNMPYNLIPDTGINTVGKQNFQNASLDFTWVDFFRQTFQMTESVENFLKGREVEVIEVLLQAKKRIDEIFPADSQLILTTDSREEEVSGKLYLNIKTNLSVDEAIDKLDLLDDTWIIYNIDKLDDIIIDVVFK